MTLIHCLQRDIPLSFRHPVNEWPTTPSSPDDNVLVALLFLFFFSLGLTSHSAPSRRPSPRGLAEEISQSARMCLVIRETETTALESPEVALLTPQRPRSGCSIFLPLSLYTASFCRRHFPLLLPSSPGHRSSLSLSLFLSLCKSAGWRDALPQTAGLGGGVSTLHQRAAHVRAIASKMSPRRLRDDSRRACNAALENAYHRDCSREQSSFSVTSAGCAQALPAFDARDNALAAAA